MEVRVRRCELCPSDAAVFCPSDAAFLCWRCDAKIHEANFLVARHVRQSICSTCNEFTGHGFSGVGFRPSAATCSSCDDSVCISSTTSCSTMSSSSSRRRRVKAEGIFVNWCGKLGMEVEVGVVQMACKMCLDGWRVLPFRVCLAASMWVGLKLSRLDMIKSKVLKGVEQISGVPAKLILAAASKLERRARPSTTNHHLQLQEGWAETES